MHSKDPEVELHEVPLPDSSLSLSKSGVYTVSRHGDDSTLLKGDGDWDAFK